MKNSEASLSSPNGTPHLDSVSPRSALPGGEVRFRGKNLRPQELKRPNVQFGPVAAPVVIGSDDFVIARVPEGALSGPAVISTNGHASNPLDVRVAVSISEGLHPVGNPALDAEGNIYATFSGSRGEQVPVAVFKIDTSYNVRPFVNELMNATGIAFDREGEMYVSSRHEGNVYRVTPGGAMSIFAEGMGVATGIAFDREQNLFVGDRSGTIFKISPEREIFVFATLEPSIAAYHLAFHPSGELYVSGPTTSSYDRVYRINQNGEVNVFYRGLGRPQGLAFDQDGNLYVVASFAGHRGIVRISPQGHAEHVLSGSALVGLALLPSGRGIIAANSCLFTIDWNVRGMPLYG